MDLNKYFDHTNLKPDATREDIRKLCKEALEYDFYSVCVNSSNVAYAKDLLSCSDVKVCAVVGFPLGACTTLTKAFETAEALEDGAEEVDMVLNVGRFKAYDYDYVRDDIKAVVTTAEQFGAKVKVILETCLLNDEEIKEACKLAMDSGAHFVKTSTGFSSGGATRSAVSLMKETVGDSMKVKASGGIRTLKDVMDMIEAGADRIGASASVSIMKEYKNTEDK